jgi:hypothetical protein
MVVEPVGQRAQIHQAVDGLNGFSAQNASQISHTTSSLLCQDEKWAIVDLSGFLQYIIRVGQ